MNPIPNIKRKIFTSYIDFVNRLFLKQNGKIGGVLNLQDSDIPLCFITISFNNEFLIAEQIRLMKKYIADKNYVHIVADNSTDKTKRKLIELACRKENVYYAGLPFNLFSKADKRPSYSHGLAMNWVYGNIIEKIKPVRFGFLDHDIFPIQPYSVIEKLENRDFYGELRNRTPENEKNKIWYLWSGFCFYYFEKIRSKQPDFLPCKVDNIFLDSGGRNFYSLYSACDMEKQTFCKPVVLQNIKDGSNYHADYIQIVDESWIHAINGSDWAKNGGKDDLLKELLKNY